MLLEITKSVVLPARVDDVWAFVRDPERVARCLPNLEAFKPEGGPDRFSTLLVERLGPFRVSIPLSITVREGSPERAMIAAVAGDDRGGQARVRGEVRASVGGSDGAVQLEVGSAVEVLGRLAGLGAVPMRRRGDQIFDQFVAAIGRALEADRG